MRPERILRFNAVFENEVNMGCYVTDFSRRDGVHLSSFSLEREPMTNLSHD